MLMNADDSSIVSMKLSVFTTAEANVVFLPSDRLRFEGITTVLTGASFGRCETYGLLSRRHLQSSHKQRLDTAALRRPPRTSSEKGIEREKSKQIAPPGEQTDRAPQLRSADELCDFQGDQS